MKTFKEYLEEGIVRKILVERDFSEERINNHLEKLKQEKEGQKQKKLF